jgi:PIN domain nuclease of toxin-antitoxin system
VTIVLDSSAILAVFHREPGWERVDAEIDDAIISAVNLAEVVAKVEDRGYPSERVRANLAGSALRIVAFDEDAAYLTGRLRPSTRMAGLSLGDRACLALAMAHDLPVMTADRAWAKLDLGIEVRVFR